MIKEVIPLADVHNLNTFGGKATNLAALIKMGLPVPDGFAISIEAFEDDGTLTKQARDDLQNYLEEDRLYAVRSSAIGEDSEGSSWAGQFESFLNINSDNVLAKAEECHNFTKERTRAYADNISASDNFEIAVVVQQMLQPEYAGVLFTKDPITGEEKFVCEYVEGLGEELVSGRADPIRIAWEEGDEVNVPFDIQKLTQLAKTAQSEFKSPQDIEWVWSEDTVWLVQARPITAIQSTSHGLDLGEPDELFYWGPSRANPLYMSDFMRAAEEFFKDMYLGQTLPNPPKTLVLFCEEKMVWLSNATGFVAFTEECFLKYSELDRFESDYSAWQTRCKELDAKQADASELVSAWRYTLFAEFSLYGAEPAINKLLARFDSKTRQEIWGRFTFPDKPTFLNAIDKELYESGIPKGLAKKYPWIEDGYSGIKTTALDYFKKRLEIVNENPPLNEFSSASRDELVEKYTLTKKEISFLDQARKLAEFMDERKAWMMHTRRYIKNSAGDIQDGWFYSEGKVNLLNSKETKEQWERYVKFKASSSTVSGVVASNGGRHFINGEIRVILGPTDSVEDDMILVVPATSPSYVPLMRKARALITDHGGMMSHAAIVGREFNLPCIVGTKQATKVLKDGDKVVLDMIKGEVIK